MAHLGFIIKLKLFKWFDKPKKHHFVVYVYSYSRERKSSIYTSIFTYLFTIFPFKLLQEFGVKTPFCPDFGLKTSKKLFSKFVVQNLQKPSNTAPLRVLLSSKFLLTPRALHPQKKRTDISPSLPPHKPS